MDTGTLLWIGSDNSMHHPVFAMPSKRWSIRNLVAREVRPIIPGTGADNSVFSLVLAQYNYQCCQPRSL